MIRLMESIRDNGLITPIIVRPKKAIDMKPYQVTEEYMLASA